MVVLEVLDALVAAEEESTAEPLVLGLVDPDVGSPDDGAPSEPPAEERVLEFPPSPVVASACCGCWLHAESRQQTEASRLTGTPTRSV